jgi:hypothetical protein
VLIPVALWVLDLTACGTRTFQAVTRLSDGGS